MGNGSSFWLKNVKRKINITARESDFDSSKVNWCFGDQKIFYFRNSKGGGLNRRWTTFMFQLLLPLPQSWQRGWWTEAPPYTCHYVLQEKNITKFGAGLCEKERWFILYKSISSPSSSFLQIVHVCTHTHFSCVHTHSRTLCCLCSGRQGQEMLSLDPLPCLSFFFSLANPFILSRNWEITVA